MASQPRHIAAGRWVYPGVAGRPGLRVRPGTSCGITELSEHEANGCEVEKSERVVVEIFAVLGEAAAPVKPCDGALDDPALGFDDEAFDGVGAFDDLDLEVRHDHCDGA